MAKIRVEVFFVVEGHQHFRGPRYQPLHPENVGSMDL
jgi:hypothetical protein